MKKLFICLVLLAGCSSESNKPKQDTRTIFEKNGYIWEDHTIQDMKYRIFFLRDNTSQTGYAIHVVNLTKDALEVELLKKQLESKKR